MKLIIGLGNPGKEYERTRHNVGWLVLDALAKDEKWQTSKKANAQYLKTEVAGKRVELLKPTTFMNNSGIAVSHALKNNSLNIEDVVVIHDDKDVPLGEYRVQKNRGAAGHNGVLSIIEHLGTKDFLRIRVGIAPNPLLARNEPEGNLPKIADTASFVLGKLTKEEQKTLQTVLERVVEEVKRII